MAPSAVPVENGHESTVPINVEKTGVGQPDKAQNKNFFDDVHFLGDKEGKVIIRSPPKFETKEEERAYQKQHLAAAFRVFARERFDEGVAGHISLRDPVNPGKTPRLHDSCMRSGSLTLPRPLLDQSSEHALFSYESVRLGPCR